MPVSEKPRKKPAPKPKQITPEEAMKIVEADKQRRCNEFQEGFIALQKKYGVVAKPMLIINADDPKTKAEPKDEE